MRVLQVSFVALFASLLCCPGASSQSTSLHGIDITDLDRKADPCNDFYEFANGTWRANHPMILRRAR